MEALMGSVKLNATYVSSRSDRIDPSKEYGGIVLYGKGTKTEWEDSGLNIKSGYIYLTESNSATRNFPSNLGKIHGSTYRSLTRGSHRPHDITAGGFSVQANNRWEFNSGAMNLHGQFVDGHRKMNKYEQTWVEEAVKQWMQTGEQNYCLPKAYHVSCQSSRIDPQKNYGGIVLYAKGTETEWKVSGLKMKSGYIYITDSDSALRDFPHEVGAIHDAVYRRLAGSKRPDDIIVGGFSVQNGVWKFNSGTLNTHGQLASRDRKINQYEEEWVKEAVEQWMQTGKQNYDLPRLYPSSSGSSFFSFSWLR
jgi:hypothetical protein